ncbi:hypothetical protein [Chryseobacterium balustinum]|uniref:Uncharacterized protein n=2 Tax=Chryseobacterium group TaxID=2782232 RepID=A0AAX2IL34_9FLAO|nr:hypothetical protein [Chryseobacterium balustinum]AZB29780.1 hypothetical protein EB354_11245 [Chryseobacterium balustinum]SKB94906.1 hypothetical protein SAMN05421800_1165 [Chryseobacterium balustinum]SQA90151.1 Uncharacterised protein [Chryseobacterium balustinum]
MFNVIELQGYSLDIKFLKIWKRNIWLLKINSLSYNMRKSENQDSITHAGRINERTKALEILAKAKKTQGKITVIRQGVGRNFKPKNEE